MSFQAQRPSGRQFSILRPVSRVAKPLLVSFLTAAAIVQPGCAGHSAPSERLGMPATSATVPVLPAPASVVNEAPIREASPLAEPAVQSTAGPAASPVAELIVEAPPASESAVPAAPAPEAPASAAAPAAAPAPPVPAPIAWQPAGASRLPFAPEIEQWRPLVRQMLAEAAAEGRLAGAAARLDDDLILAMIQQESAGDPAAESWAGALGLMQVMPGTFSGLMYGDWNRITPRETILDPAQNVRAGVRYMAEALQIHRGSLYWSVASYNAGAGATQAWLSLGLTAVPPVGGYWETAEYAPRILTNYAAHRPDLAVDIPAPIAPEQLPGIIALLTSAGLW